MNALAPCTLPDEAEPFAQQMRMLTELADYAMRMARIAVEQYEASVAAERAFAVAAERAFANAPPAETAANPPRRQPDPGSLFIRVARVVQNCITGQTRLAAGLPAARAPRPRGSVSEAANAISVAEESRAEPVRQALRTVTRNHPQGPKLLRAGLENLAAALTANPPRTGDLSELFRHVCDETGIRLDPAQWRKAARDLACEIRAAPA